VVYGMCKFIGNYRKGDVIGGWEDVRREDYVSMHVSLVIMLVPHEYEGILGRSKKVALGRARAPCRIKHEYAVSVLVLGCAVRVQG
jgi:hypothetical protein